MIEGNSSCGAGPCPCFSTSAAAFDDAEVVFEAAAMLATLGAAGGAGVPLLLPPTWILLALRTCTAEILRLPEARMPASPASMVPAGAIKSTSPGATPTTVASTPIPPPVASPARSGLTFALWGSTITRVGGADCTVFDAEPAAILPVE